jgi:hypothetical protein
MSKLDDEVAERLTRAQKPIFVDPELFAGLAKAKLRRERRKRVTALGSVVAIGALGVATFALANRSGSMSPVATGTTPRGFVSPGTAATSIPGIPFPACHVSTSTYFAPDVGAIYLFGRGSKDKACPADLEAGNAYLAVYRPGLITPRSKPDIVGPLECATGCRIFGEPDIDGDGYPELAVVVVDGAGADSIELYRVRPTADPPITQIMVSSPNGPTPIAFDWGGVGNYRSGASCLTVGPSGTGRGDELDVWYANRRKGTWHLVQRFLQIGGDLFHLDHVERSSADNVKGFLPDGGGTDFCGASVSP